MAVWMLSPLASQDDPHWKGYGYKRPLLVEAQDTSEVRLKATKWYKENFQGSPQIRVDNFYRSAFEDEKLYQLVKLTEDTAMAEQQKYPLVQ